MEKYNKNNAEILSDQTNSEATCQGVDKAEMEKTLDKKLESEKKLDQNAETKSTKKSFVEQDGSNKILEIKNLNKSFGLNHVLKDISFSMKKGEVIAIIGSSGGGKSTLLRCLTFLERAQSGSIWIGGEEIVASEMRPVKPKFMVVQKVPVDTKLKFMLKSKEYGKKNTKFFVRIPAENAYKRKFFKRYVPTDKNGIPLSEAEVSIYPNDNILREKALKMGLVFQDFNLFPHKTVIENLILAPMLVKGMDRQVAITIAEEQLAKVGLSDKANSYPFEISGGQKQRVAIARALCMSPEILCFDEPTSALDPELTGEVLKVISGLRDSNTTMLIVTHEIMFAREVADKVIFLDGGKILEYGDAKEVIDNPTEQRTKDFMDKILKA